MKKRILITEEELKKLVESRAKELVSSENEKYRMELSLKEANLSALQGQINPHFLYNTLDCIRGMAMLKDEDEIAEVVQALSRFFRYSISGKKNVVTLEEEYTNIRNYCKIQQYRFPGRFRMVIESEPSLANAMIPKLSLQPVIENAIIHGMQDTVEGGLITVKTERNDSYITIKVSDNGKGMSAEELLSMTRRIYEDEDSPPTSGRHSGIGIQNVHRRLRLLFGPQYGVGVFSVPDQGTDIVLLMPYQANTEESRV